MKSVLLDTHAWAWTLTGGSHLSKRARASIKRAQTIPTTAGIMPWAHRDPRLLAATAIRYNLPIGTSPGRNIMPPPW